MVDLETMAVSPNAVVLTLGAVHFNPYGNGYGEKLYLRLNLDDQDKMGREIDPNTIDWWSKQDPVVMEEAFSEDNRISVVDAMESTSNSTIFVDYEKLEFPLVLRHWKEGDVFQPFGMEGKSKKVSKLFKDEKLSVVEKESTWLLCSNNQIIWVVRKRQDERYKINSQTNKILKIAIGS